MADEELHKTPTDGQTEVEASVTVEEAEPTTADQGKGAHDDHPTLAEAATYVENDEIPLGKIQSVLDSTVDESQLTPQMRRMMQRQKENSKRVEESIKGTKANPVGVRDYSSTRAYCSGCSSSGVLANSRRSSSLTSYPRPNASTYCL